MPITAKLSRQFYERFGDDIVNELVEWLNAVDQSYRQEFKDLFDANFSRLERELVAMEQRFELRLAQVRAELEASIARSESRLIAWSFVFWLAQLGTMVGLLKLAGVL